MTQARTMTDPDAIVEFLLAGRAVLTLKSLATEQHYTFRVNRSDDGNLFFVSVRTGGDNDYSYIGIVRNFEFRTTAKSRMPSTAPCCRAFTWFLAHAIARRIPEQLEVRHEGQCGRCGRDLTHPESIDRGIGPDCAEQMGMVRAPSPARRSKRSKAAARKPELHELMAAG